MDVYIESNMYLLIRKTSIDDDDDDDKKTPKHYTNVNDGNRPYLFISHKYSVIV